MAVVGSLVVAALATAGTPPPPDGPACPPTLSCSLVPAAYAQTKPDDPNAYGNYDLADRPSDGDDIDYIVIHDTEETYDDAIRVMQLPRTGVSAHYLVRSSDGQITQLVHTKDIAYHAGNYWFNMHSIGIEHEGMLVDGHRWYTEEMYQASARLVRYLAARYHIPLDRQHILGHEELPGATPLKAATMHYDPGPYWDWAHYLELLGRPLRAGPRSDAATAGVSETVVRAARKVDPPVPLDARDREVRTPPSVITIAPRFDANVQPLRSCERTIGCVDLPPTGSSVVYLRSAPDSAAPLITDPLLHPDGSPGTTTVDDWSARASVGQSFVVAARADDWTGVWFGGQLAWFDNPFGRWAVAARGTLITPRPGRPTIPVYGAAYPEPGAYPPTIPATPLVPLPYTIASGQIYLGTRQLLGTDYYARFDPAQVPDSHTMVVGDRSLWEISFNHRRAFVDAADVQVVTE